MDEHEERLLMKMSGLPYTALPEKQIRKTHLTEADYRKPSCMRIPNRKSYWLSSDPEDVTCKRCKRHLKIVKLAKDPNISIIEAKRRMNNGQ